MSQSKVKEIDDKIRQLQSTLEYSESMIALLMSEQSLIDMQIEQYSRSGLSIKLQLADLKAERKDTI